LCVIFIHMWKFPAHKKGTSSGENRDDQHVRHTNHLILALIAFIVCWMVGSCAYFYKKTDPSSANPPVLVLDATHSLSVGGFFTNAPSVRMISPTNQTSVLSAGSREKKQYEPGDVLIVKYFHIIVVVLESPKSSEGDYLVFYRDHNNTLQKISLPRMMLMVPPSESLSASSTLLD
jgi:hypothetical protein